MKTVMITGCNGGIGKASVRRFLSEGWHVVGMDVADTQAENAGDPAFTYVKGDLSKKESRILLRLRLRCRERSMRLSMLPELLRGSETTSLR